MDDEKLATAYHEAAHIVVAVHFGAVPQCVSVSPGGGDWEGEAPVKWSEGPGPNRRQKIIKAAIAGPLAQVKFRAQSKQGPVIFERTDRLDILLAIVRTGELADDAKPIITFSTREGVQCPFEIKNINDIDDLFRLARLAGEWSDSDLYAMVDEVRELLDDSKVWASVATLATALATHGQVEPAVVSELLSQQR